MASVLALFAALVQFAQGSFYGKRQVYDVIEVTRYHYSVRSWNGWFGSHSLHGAALICLRTTRDRLRASE